MRIPPLNSKKVTPKGSFLSLSLNELDRVTYFSFLIDDSLCHDGRIIQIFASQDDVFSDEVNVFLVSPRGNYNFVPVLGVIDGCLNGEICGAQGNVSYRKG